MLKIPEIIELDERFGTVIDFFNGKITTPPRVNILGLEHSYTLGGLHASKKNCRFIADEGVMILDIDFSSYYAYIMLLYVQWFWQGMTRERFKDMVSARILAKWSGDSVKASELKQKIAPAYGRARRQDPDGGLAICAVGQLIMSDLLSKLEALGGIELINTDTDGIIVAYPSDKESALINVVECFKERIKIPIEYQVIHRIYQQERTFYVAELGESFTFRDGKKLIMAPDLHKYKVRGKTCVDIVRDAIVANILYGEDVRKFITECEDFDSFKYTVRRNPLEVAAYRWNVNGKWYKLSDSFDVYAVRNTNFGIVASLNYNSSVPKKLASTSEHSLIDIKGAMSMDKLDLKFYIDEAVSYIEMWNRKRAANERGTYNE